MFAATFVPVYIFYIKGSIIHIVRLWLDWRIVYLLEKKNYFYFAMQINSLFIYFSFYLYVRTYYIWWELYFLNWYYSYFVREYFYIVLYLQFMYGKLD